MTSLLVPLPKATGLATTDARTHFHHTARTPDDGSVDGSHSILVSNERASSSVSLSDGVSDLTTGSSSELTTRKPLSSHTPAAVILTTRMGPAMTRRPVLMRKSARYRLKSAQFRLAREDHSTTKTGPPNSDPLVRTTALQHRQSDVVEEDPAFPQPLSIDDWHLRGIAGSHQWEDGNVCSTQEGFARHFVTNKLPGDVRQPLATILGPFETECESTASLVSSPRSSTDEGLSQRGTPSSSDLSSEALVEICMKRRGRYLQRIMAEFNTMFFGSPSGSPSGSVRHQTEGSESTSSDNVAKDCSSSDQVSQDCSAIRAGEKRAHVRDLSCDDEDDGNQKRRKKFNSTNSTAPQARLLACPFNKHDSKIYGPYNDDKAMARKFKRCGGPGWDDIPRLKEHLYRVHNTPIECSRCWLNLKTEKDLADHVRKQTPCEVRPQLVEWIPREKIKVLKDRKKALLGQSERERWEYVYRILFSEEPSLPSPYYDDVEQRYHDDTSLSPSSRDHAAFEQYLGNNLHGRVEKAIEAKLDEQMLPVQESLKRALAEIIRECQAQLFREWGQLSSEVGQRTKGESSTQTLKTDAATGQVSHGEPSLPERQSWDESLSAFYIEPDPALFKDAFGSPLQFKDNREGPSQAVTDSGYKSLLPNSDIVPSEPLEIPTPLPDIDKCSLQQDLEDPCLAELDLPAVFDWSDYLVETGSGPTRKS